MRLFRVGLCAFVVVAMAVAAQAQGSGSLKVTSYPSGANVSIDGIDTGKTTPMSESLSIGTHSVTVSVPFAGWNPDTRTVTIVSGNNDLSVTLLPNLTTGPQGATGPQGVPGMAGPPGPAGATGPAGTDGAAGATGATGAQGIPGADGAPGATGATGAQGAPGQNGADGAPGATGATGPIGPQGVPGAQGATGPAGAVGATGPAGAAGATGPAGPQGVAGATGAQGPQGVPGATGAQGPQGAQGAAGATGPQGPAGTSGAGDDPAQSCLVDEFVSGAQTVSGTVSPTSFFGSVGALGWSSNTAIHPAFDGQSPGLIAVSAPIGSLTSGNAINHLRLYQYLFGSTTANKGALYSATPVRMKWIQRRSTSSLPTVWRVGFMDNENGNPPNGIYFELRPGSPNARWFAVHRSGTAVTEIDTLKDEGTGTFQMLEIRRSTASGATEFYINNVLKATISTDLPNPALPLNLVLQLGGQGDVHVDYASLCLAGYQRFLP